MKTKEQIQAKIKEIDDRMNNYPSCDFDIEYAKIEMLQWVLEDEE
jgi:hypothetical protein